MRLYHVLTALAYGCALWMVLCFHERTGFDCATAAALAFALSAALALAAECWRDHQRDKLTAARERLGAWRAQPLDWPATTAIRDDTRRVADSETESIQCVP